MNQKKSDHQQPAQENRKADQRISVTKSRVEDNRSREHHRAR